MKPSKNHFILLGALGVILLWVNMVLNGTLAALNKVQSTGFFPDGRPLRSVYTGYGLLDYQITVLTVFFDSITNGANPGSTLLVVDLTTVLHCANVWALIDSRRRGVSTEWMRHPLLFIATWNVFGAGVILPLFCYINYTTRTNRRDHTIPLNEAQAFPVVTFVASFYNLLLFAPAFFGWGTHHEHGYAAHYQWVTAVGYGGVLVALGRPWAKTTKDPKNPNVEQNYVFATYLVTGAFAATVHLYVLLRLYTSTNPDVTFTRLFVPSFGNVSGSQQNIIIEGVHIFGQCDWHVITLTCMLHAYLQMEDCSMIQAPLADFLNIATEHEALLAWTFIVLSTVVFGPGATGSFGLAIREFGLRNQVPAHAVKKGE